MISSLKILKIKKLHQHEQINFKRLKNLKKRISNDGIFKAPIVADSKSLVVLDGHHRLNCCLSMGLSKIPCILVDYEKDNSIKVFSRNKKIKISKKIILSKSKELELFPYKTTRHFIPYRLYKLNISLSQLK